LVKKRTAHGVTKCDLRKLARELKRETRDLRAIDLPKLSDRQRQVTARTLRPVVAAVHTLVAKLSHD
jgi:hypothetical protein